MDKEKRPIGYWLKEADKSISAAVNKNLEQYELTRFHWQVLNTVYTKEEATKEDILNLLKNFFDSSHLSDILNDLTKKNWLTKEKNSASGITMIQMTGEGKAAFTEISATQQRTRMQLFQGITNEEYETTIKVLKQLIDNASS